MGYFWHPGYFLNNTVATQGWNILFLFEFVDKWYREMKKSQIWVGDWSMLWEIYAYRWTH